MLDMPAWKNYATVNYNEIKTTKDLLSRLQILTIRLALNL